MKTGIIGLGHVGMNLATRFARAGVVVVGYDVASGDPYPHEDLSSCDFVVIAVDTPGGPGGTAVVSRVSSAVEKVPNDRVLIRSTIPPGTTEHLQSRYGKHLCVSPEYVGESPFAQGDRGAWPSDADFQIVGGSSPDTSWFVEKLTEIFGPQPRFFQCSSTEAEIIKYMENSYFATKVTFVNEFFELCADMGADWGTVREGWLLDPRVERDHTAVFASRRGYDGRCLPKDMDAIIHFAQDRGVPMLLLQAAREANARFAGRSRP